MLRANHSAHQVSLFVVACTDVVLEVASPTMCRPAVVTIEGQRRTWKISPSATRATSPEEANLSSSAFMHDAAGQESESEDEGEEMRGLGSRKPRQRASLETEGDSPMPEAESTAAWERLMAPMPISLGIGVSGLPWDRSSDSRTTRDSRDDDDDDNLVRSGLAGGLHTSAAAAQQHTHKHKQRYHEQAEPLASPEQA